MTSLEIIANHVDKDFVPAADSEPALVPVEHAELAPALEHSAGPDIEAAPQTEEVKPVAETHDDATAEYKATVDTQAEDPTTSAPSDVEETHEEKQDASADSWYAHNKKTLLIT